jgi:hypothetical protein
MMVVARRLPVCGRLNFGKAAMLASMGAELDRVRAVVPTIAPPQGDSDDLLRRSLGRWARRRAEVESEIQHRHQSMRISSSDVLHDWE